MSMLFRFQFRALLGLIYPILELKYFSLNFFSSCYQNDLRVLIYHDVLDEDIEKIKRQINWLQKRWKILSPGEFEKMILGEEKIAGRNLLITFDDGFYSSLTIAKEVLEPLKISAIFFIVSDFCKLTGQLNIRKFITDNFFPESISPDIRDDAKNLSLEDIKYLNEKGHEIGAHTKTHAKLSSIKEFPRLYSEIVQSADELEVYLGTKIKSFAYTFGNLESFSQEALTIAKSRFQFIFSGLRGSNLKNNIRSSIRRDAVSPSDPPWLLGAILLGIFDFRYLKSLEILDSWVKNCEK